MIVTVKKPVKRLKRQTPRFTYVHHVMWGTLCLMMFSVLLALWTANRSLDQKSVSLEQQVASVRKTPQQACKARITWAGGTTKAFTIKTGGHDRSYLVHLPEKFSSTASYPALFFFPGKSVSAERAEAAMGLNSLPAVIVYPEPTAGKDEYLSWEGAPYSSGVNDVQFVSDILDALDSQLCLERSHIYAAGMSNGGGFTSLLSCKLGDRFAAYGIVAGAMYYPAGACEPSRPAPLINIHGDQDANVPYFGSEERKLPAIEQWMASRAQENGCAAEPKISHIGTNDTVTTWLSCKNGATVQNIRLGGIEHLWRPDAPQILWKFMSQYSL